MQSMEMTSLLKAWGDALCRYQVRMPGQPALDGGLLCPACYAMHGRSGDAVFPLLMLSKLTGDLRYRDCAISLWEWSKQMDAPDGAVWNDRNSTWKGITVFSALSLGETLLHCADAVPEALLSQMRSRYEVMCEFLMAGILDQPGTVVNYQMAGLAAMALAGKVTGDERYLDFARERVARCLSFFTEEGLLTGESGVGARERTARGCGGLDVGYSVEESLPSLAYYGWLAGDEACMRRAAEGYEALLPLMLPDGGWDNSFGVRNDKWTYWGSRTSDGCQFGLLLLADRNPAFQPAAMRNMRLLAETTHEGLLYGGPHLQALGEKPCIHHTFSHAKTLAMCLAYGLAGEERLSPVVVQPGHIHLPIADAHLVRIGPWRMTTSANDGVRYRKHYTGGGMISMLWHDAARAILAGSVSRATMDEPQNMLLHRGDWMSNIPSIHFGPFHSALDPDAHHFMEEETQQRVVLRALGALYSNDGKHLKGSRYDMRYALTERGLRIEVCLRGIPHGGAAMCLPLVYAPGADLAQDGERWRLRSNDGNVTVQCSQPVHWQRTFVSYTPGMRYAVLDIPLSEGLPICITITYEKDHRL